MSGSEKEKESVAEASPEASEETAETPELSEMVQLKVELEAQKTAAKEAQERYLRIFADHENYKKRTQKDLLDQMKFANERLLKEILPAIDNLDRAIVHSKETRDFEKMLEGVTLIQKQLLSVLDKFGVKPIESLNQCFDPFYHQSVGQTEIEADSEIQENQVVNEAQKGYFIHDRVLRPSLVIVAKKKEPKN